MYEIYYHLLNRKYPTLVKFKTEKDMEEHYNIWVAGDDYHFCEFYFCNREYIPEWMK